MRHPKGKDFSVYSKTISRIFLINLYCQVMFVLLVVLSST